MAAKILDGKSLSNSIIAGLEKQLKSLPNGIVPKLAIVVAGDNPASKVYVKSKLSKAESIGMKAQLVSLPSSATQGQLISAIQKLNADKSVSGMIVQLPLPKHMDEHEALCAVDPKKDLDGFHPQNLGLLLVGRPGFVSATPKGILRLLDEYRIPIEGRHAVVVGRSNIVGKPLASLLLNRDATVTLCHSKTHNLSEFTRTADILVAAVGKPKIIKADMVKKGAVVIDVGINKSADGMVGDVDFEPVSKVASYITPVPGGVGPMTIAMLLENTLVAARQ